MPFSCALSEMSRNLDTEAVVLQGTETKVFQVPHASSPLQPLVMSLKDLPRVSSVWIFCLRPLQIEDGQRKAVACGPGEASAVTERWQSGAATSAELPLGVKIVFVSAELESCVCGRHSSLTPAAVPISLFVSMPRAGSGDAGSVSWVSWAPGSKSCN